MYGTAVAGQAYWYSRGYSGTLDPELLLRASVFVDGIGWRMTKTGNIVPRFPGQPVSPTQERQWPRTGATDVYGNKIPDSSVPDAVVRATYEAAYHERQNPGSLNFTLRADEHISREVFGDVSFSYYFVSQQGTPQTGIMRTAPVVPAVMTEIAPLLLGGGSNPYGITGVVA